MAAAAVAFAVPAAAHPLGNFTSNTAAALVLARDAVRITYVLDLAEVPALQVRQQIDVADDGVDDAEAEGFREARCAQIVRDLTLTVADAVAPISVQASTLDFPQGQAGLTTLRLVCELVAPADLGRPATVTFSDATLPGRIGWREVTAAGDATTLVASDVPATSPSALLQRYPADRLGTPERVVAARLEVAPGGAAAAAPAAGDNGAGIPVDRLTQAFTDLVARRDLTPGFALLAIAIALVLGTLHAVAPGHGKTLMAAYLVGQRGTPRQALALGATVATTHTIGVLALGIVLTATQAVAPERLYPWLGVASGLLFAGVGLTLLRRGLRVRRHANDHGHAHPHHDAHDAPHGGANGHDHGSHGHDHGPQGHDHGAPLTWRSLVAPGLAGGLLPSPSALVVLLGGIALGRAWFGVLLVIAYGIGMAATLLAAGWLLLRGRAAIERRAQRGGWRLAGRAATALPVVTSTLIVVGGLVVAAGAARTL